VSELVRGCLEVVADESESKGVEESVDLC
jgi:hypothetical protein